MGNVGSRPSWQLKQADTLENQLTNLSAGSELSHLIPIALLNHFALRSMDKKKVAYVIITFKDGLAFVLDGGAVKT